MTAGGPSRPSTTRRRILGGLASAIAVGTAGCLVRGDSSDLEGQLALDGSNTVLPHGAAVAEEFMWRNNRVNISVRGSGTGAGFQRFCAGETVIQNASREILDDERERCTANGVEWLELPVVLDGIAIWVHPDNTWCECLSVDQLSEMWRRNSPINRWSDVDPEWPDRQISFYGRDSASGTFDYFTHHITGEYGNIRSDYSGTPDTNVIVRGVSGDLDAIGFGGAGYYFENADVLDLVAVRDNDACIEPSLETIEGLTYQPLSREMYLYVNRDALADEILAAFLSFYFQEIDPDSPAYQIGLDRGFVDPGETITWTQWAARRVGFFGIPDDQLQRTADTLHEAIEEAQS